MFTKRKTIVAFLLAFITMVVITPIALTACSAPNDQTIDQNGSGSNNQTVLGEEKDDNSVKHYEIALNMQNFDDFLEYEYTFSYANATPNYKGSSHLISGVLSFAYYENVVVTFRIEKSGTTMYKDIDIKLNAAGNGGFYTEDKIYTDAVAQLNGNSNLTVSIQNVKGTVIFNI